MTRDELAAALAVAEIMDVHSTVHTPTPHYVFANEVIRLLKGGDLTTCDECGQDHRAEEHHGMVTFTHACRCLRCQP